MEFQTTQNGNELTVTIQGQLDTRTSPVLEEGISDKFDDIESLVFDFTDVEYISSAGLRVLLECQKVMNKQGSMVIRNVNDTVMEVFEVTKFIDFLSVE